MTPKALRKAQIVFPEHLEEGCREEGTFELDLDGWVGFRYVRKRGEHSRRKKSKEQRHRGGINPHRSRESSSLGRRQREEETRSLGRGLAAITAPASAAS